jgi:hypothetical protein
VVHVQVGEDDVGDVRHVKAGTADLHVDEVVLAHQRMIERGELSPGIRRVCRDDGGTPAVDEDEPVVALDEVGDHGNLGIFVRAADPDPAVGHGDLPRAQYKDAVRHDRPLVNSFGDKTITDMIVY